MVKSWGFPFPVAAEPESLQHLHLIVCQHALGKPANATEIWGEAPRAPEAKHLKVAVWTEVNGDREFKIFPRAEESREGSASWGI